MANETQDSTTKILEGAFWSWVSTVINLFSLLLIGKIFAVFLSKEEVAIFSLILVWSDGLNLFFGYGLQTSIPKLISSTSGEEKNKLSSSLFVFTLLNASLFALLFILGWILIDNLPLMNSLTTSVLYPYFWTVPFLFVLGLLRDILLAQLSGFQVFEKRALGITIASVIQISLVVFTLIVYKGRLISLTTAYIFGYSLVVLFLCFAIPHRLQFQLDWHLISKSIRFSSILWINSLLNYLTQRFDTVILLYLTQNPIQVALYEMAKRICQLISRMLNALLLPYLPKISELLTQNQTEKSTQFFLRAHNTIATLTYLGIFLLPFLQNTIIQLLFSKAYLDIDIVLIPLVSAIAIAVLTGISGQTLIAFNRPHIVTLTNIGTVCINLIFNFYLIPLWGMKGAGISVLISYLFSFTMQTYWVRIMGIQFPIRRFLIPHLFLTAFLIAYFTGFLTLGLSFTLFLCLLIISFYLDLIPYAQIRTTVMGIIGKSFNVKGSQ